MEIYLFITNTIIERPRRLPRLPAPLVRPTLGSLGTDPARLVRVIPLAHLLKLSETFFLKVMDASRADLVVFS